MKPARILAQTRSDGREVYCVFNAAGRQIGAAWYTQRKDAVDQARALGYEIVES